MQRSLTEFLKTAKKRRTEQEQPAEPNSCNLLPESSCIVDLEGGSDKEENSSSQVASQSECNTTGDLFISQNDISRAVNRQLTDTEKVGFIKNFFKPPQQYEFPLVKNRKVQRKWLELNPRLAYSPADQGLYCVSCVVFANRTAGKGDHEQTKQFVCEPFKKFKNCQERWTRHCSREYHMLAELKTEMFLSTESSGKTVAVQLNKDVVKLIKRNRAMIASIIKGIIFAAQHNLPLRGHKDSGELTLAEPPKNDGVLRAVLRLIGRAGDSGVEHLTTAPRNAQYLSPDIQNGLLKCIAKVIMKEVVHKIGKANALTIMADETSSSNREFLSMVVRYVDSETMCVDEAFLGFVQLAGCTGDEIATEILKNVMSAGFDTNKIVGQAYDGASNMSGCVKGVQSRIREIIPTAEYFHCATHRLNLVATDAAATVRIQQVLHCIKKIINFFGGSPSRSAVLRRHIELYAPESNRWKVVSLCETRWVERHESLLAFKELLVPILSSLKELSRSDSESNAETMLWKISSFHSILVLLLVTEIAVELKSISLYLQKKDANLIAAHEMIQTIQKSLQERLDSRNNFDDLYSKCYALAKELNIREEFPVFHDEIHEHGTTLKERKRKQIQDIAISDVVRDDTSIDDYYYATVYMPYICSLRDQLAERFSDKQRLAFTLQYLLPKHIVSFGEVDELDPDVFTPVFSNYQPVLKGCCTDVASFNAELRLWKTKWVAVKADDRPQSLLDTVNLFRTAPALQSFFPTVLELLKILLTLPVSTATSERSFSTLARILTDNRTTMTAQRLSDLAVLSFYYSKSTTVNIDDIIDLFAEEPHRILLKEIVRFYH